MTQIASIKPKKFRLIAAGSAVLIAVSVAGSANAFSFSSISGILENFAPYLDQVLGVDISPYIDKIQSSTGFAESVLSGDWGKAAEFASLALGDYGVIDPKKLKDAMQTAAAVKYNENEQFDYGFGQAGASQLEALNTKEAIGGIQSEINLGDAAQKSWLTKGDALAETVKSSATFAKDAFKETNSLNVLKTMSAQNAAQASVTAQGVSEIKSNGRSLMRIEDTLNDIRAASNADARVRLRGFNTASGAATTTVGTFTGLLGGR